jgi:hypothetical protein
VNEVEPAFWKSKKLLACAANHLIVGLISIFGIIKQPSATGQIVTGTLAELGTVSAAHQVSQSATDRARAYSPNYPLPAAPPGEPPPLP